MATATDAQFLTLAQWLSPAFPVGAFHFSHGLESAIDQRVVTDGVSLAAWIEDVVRHGTGRNDALFIAAAFRAKTEPELACIDELARAMSGTRERLLETSELGAAFRAIAEPLIGQKLAAHVYPVVLGRALALAELPLAPALALYLQAFVSNLVSVGQRLIPVGQSAAQRVIAELRPLVTEVAAQATDDDLEQLNSRCILAEIASMQHETQFSRVFRT